MSGTLPETNTAGHASAAVPVVSGSNDSNQSRNEPGLPFSPAGLELLYDYERDRVRSQNHAFFLATHWILMRAGLRRTTTQLNLPGSYEIHSALSTTDPDHVVRTALGSGNEITGTTPNGTTVPGASNALHGGHTAAEVLSALTERPESGWAERIDTVQTTPAVFLYINPLALEEGYYKVEFYALNDKSMIVRITNDFCPAARKHRLTRPTEAALTTGETKSTEASCFPVLDFVHFGPQYTTALQVFYNVALLERSVFKELLERMGLAVYGIIPHSIGIYDDKTERPREAPSRPRDYRDNYGYNDDRLRAPYGPRRPTPGPGGLGGPLYVPPAGGGGGLGRSDLDPLGGVGAGMLADPRGFRRPGPPAFPGIAPPGARFDPFGPFGPGRGPHPGPLGPGGHPGQFGGPDPDHEQPPPGFDDMFM